MISTNYILRSKKMSPACFDSVESKPTDDMELASLNTLEQVLHFARLFSQEIRHDTKSRRIYRSFAALTENQFEALLAFSIWKVRALSPRFL